MPLLCSPDRDEPSDQTFDELFRLLKDSVAGMQSDVGAIAENYRAMNSMGDDIIEAAEASKEQERAAYAAFLREKNHA